MKMESSKVFILTATILVSKMLTMGGIHFLVTTIIDVTVVYMLVEERQGVKMRAI